MLDSVVCDICIYDAVVVPAISANVELVSLACYDVCEESII